MEWIRISQNKLKIMLSAEDARRYALDCKTADYADAVTRDAFREILTEVRAETGFDATEDKVYIQMYPSKEGGCELFVTKMGLLLTESTTVGNHTPPWPSGGTRPHKPRRREYALSFAELEDLLSLCRRMLPFYKGESEAWQDERGSWLLLLFDHGDPLSAREDFRFALEYGTCTSATEAKLYLGEHGKPICKKNAISVLGKL